MNTIVKTRIIKIGNSHGVRIPKLLLDQSGLGEEVELAVQPHQLVIRPVQRPRYNWEEQFKAMAKYGDDQLLDAELKTSFSRWDDDKPHPSTSLRRERLD